MEKHSLRSVYFENLKGLKGADIIFSKTLTAIMGVNGSGKTTVIHALACLYMPDGKGEDHKFPEFFIPNTDALWNGSKLNAILEMEDPKRETPLQTKEYRKAADRWSPRYNSRPKRNVYYIGIDSCLPDIEKKTTTSRINYKTIEQVDKQSEKILEISAYILNKDYKILLDNLYNGKHFLGVSLQTGLKYSSLSMGSGEQRVIRIISTVIKAEPYSLILIDEIDLLLHVSALRRLITKLSELSEDRHIQIVFTTHSLEMTHFDSVKIQYLYNTKEDNTLVYEKITPDLIYDMTGHKAKSHRIYVEDIFAKTIVETLIRKKGKSTFVDVIPFGAIDNAFTLSASFVIQNEPLDNVLIILDGDRYKEDSEKENQIQKKLSGNDEDAKDKRTKALSIIKEFNLPEATSPEKFIFDAIIRCMPTDNEIFNTASEIKSVNNQHEWIGLIRDKLGCDDSYIIRELYTFAYEQEKDELFISYLSTIENWLDNNCK